jgi:predicted DNA-binding transcriptional regulator YafY
MAKRDSFLRYISIISKLRNQGDSTFEEISDYLEMQSEIRDFNPVISKRTFQRDAAEILSLFGIEIKFDFSRKVYFILEDDETRDMNNRLLEALDMLSLCHGAENASPYVIFEKRRPQGTHLFNTLLDAIRARQTVRFRYNKFWDDEIKERLVDPYALKESRERWYLVGRDHQDNIIKTFGLDRISDLTEVRKKFTYPAHYDPQEKFKHCFGVLGDEKHDAEEIVLSIDPFQGKYIKSFPLHDSQEILMDTKKELRIRLFMYITRDLIMELLSLGDTLKVVKPRRLRNEMVRSYKETLEKYNEV